MQTFGKILESSSIKIVGSLGFRRDQSKPHGILEPVLGCFPHRPNLSEILQQQDFQNVRFFIQAFVLNLISARTDNCQSRCIYSNYKILLECSLFLKERDVSPGSLSSFYTFVHCYLSYLKEGHFNY